MQTETNITLQEIIKLKNKLRNDISGLIYEFSNATGTTVTAVNVVNMDIGGMSKTPFILDVVVKVNL